MPSKTESKDMLAEFEAWLPKELAALYYALWQEVASLNVGWNSYNELYGSGDDRIELLNQTAPSFFSFLESALLGDSLLSIIRLTDPMKSAGRSNLTLLRLPGKLQALGYSELGRKIEAALDPLKAAVEPLRDYRNKWLSHRDLKVCLNVDQQGWGFSRPDVGKMVRMVNGILNVIEREISNGETRYEDVIEHGGADHLIFALEEARRSEIRERKEALRRVRR